MNKQDKETLRPIIRALYGLEARLAEKAPNITMYDIAGKVPVSDFARGLAISLEQVIKKQQ